MLSRARGHAEAVRRGTTDRSWKRQLAELDAEDFAGNVSMPKARSGGNRQRPAERAFEGGELTP
jgi:hypothetical protein